MPTGQSDGILRQLRRAALRRGGAELSDAELLQAFVARRDEAAFAALVQRHGPMVLGVCRRVLGNEADAEDAFQATFLVLVRKAPAVVPPSQVGNWLYGVAHRTALKAKAMSGRRRVKEREAGERPRPEGPDEVWHRLQRLLDDELARLPDHYRVAVVLCDLEGRTLREAARQLGCPQGTVASRLARARALLARRLARHGLALTGGVLGALLSRSAAAGVPAPVAGETVRAAAHVAAGGAAAAVLSARAVALAEGVVKGMLLTRLKWSAGLVLAALLGLGASLFAARGLIAGEKPGGTARAAEGGPKTPGGGPDKTKGRIYYHRGGQLAAVRPDGTGGTDLGKVADADLLGYQPYSARLSPDGKRLAFGKAVYVGPGAHPPDKIYLRDAGKSERGELLAERAGSELHNWTWSPDGTRLAFVSWDAPDVFRNWIVDIKMKKVREINLPRFKTKDGKEHGMTIEAWSPDGASFLANGANGDGLHLVKADGSTARRLTKKGGTLTGSSRFSPDGRRVLFVRWDDQGGQSLHVVEVASGKARAVVEAKNFTDMQACWSPDGRRIAYCVTLLDVKGKRQGETSLFVTDVEGKNTSTVLTEKHGPDEVRLVLTDWR